MPASPQQKQAFLPKVTPATTSLIETTTPSTPSLSTIPPFKSDPSAVPTSLNSPGQGSVPIGNPPPPGNSHSLARLNTSQDRNMLHETLHVINEHITDMRSPPRNGSLPSAATDSGSEYSSHLEHRMSYIQGEETDEEEESTHTRIEVEAWSPDDVAEYLFTVGVEKRHCEVFRDQEISGEVLLDMDQSSLFLKAFDLGPVGRRLKTWQKIKSLQDEVSGAGPPTRRTTQSYGSEVGSEGRMRSRTNTLTSSIYKPSLDDGRKSSHGKRTSISSTPRMDPSQAMSPASSHFLDGHPSRSLHEKRPSAASVRDLHHSRRHSSNDFHAAAGSTPKAGYSGFTPTTPASERAHRKQPSFDRNWTLGSATASASAATLSASFNQRPVSSAGFPDTNDSSDPALQDSAVDLDRGYFSGTEADDNRRNVLRKRESITVHSRTSSYAEEQRARAGTSTVSRHSRLSVSSINDQQTSAAQRYYGLSAPRRAGSTHTNDSFSMFVSKDASSPAVTKLDIGKSSASSAIEPPSASPANRSGLHSDWARPGIKSASLGLRAISDAVTGQERSKIAARPESAKDSPMVSPSRAGSSAASVGASFDLDSAEPGKSPSTITTSTNKSKKKTKQETSAYTRGLQRIPPREAMADADYSGWMKKKSSNLMTTWKPRLFVLKGRRLAYYYSEDDDQEKGLIDISFHRVLPADNEKLTGLHATLTGASNTPTIPAGSSVQTLADADAATMIDKGSDSMFIFKLVPPRVGLSRAVTFTKPMVHYFAVPNIKQGRLWMAALMKATIDRDDTQPITTTYQQKTISLTKARQMRHRPPALMGLDEKVDGEKKQVKKDSNGLGIFNETDSGVSGVDKLGLHQIASARLQPDNYGPGQDIAALSPKSA